MMLEYGGAIKLGLALDSPDVIHDLSLVVFSTSYVLKVMARSPLGIQAESLADLPWAGPPTTHAVKLHQLLTLKLIG